MPMPQETIHEEIKWLEEQLEAKKRTLAEKEPALAEAADHKEREMVRDIIKEAAAVPSSNLLPPTFSNLSDDDAQAKAYALKEKEHQHVIEELIATAFAKGIASAIRVAHALRNPHILDEFHDTLADRYYEKLLETRKIKKIK